MMSLAVVLARGDALDTIWTPPVLIGTGVTLLVVSALLLIASRKPKRGPATRKWQELSCGALAVFGLIFLCSGLFGS